MIGLFREVHQIYRKPEKVKIKVSEFTVCVTNEDTNTVETRGALLLSSGWNVTHTQGTILFTPPEPCLTKGAPKKAVLG